MVDTIRAALDDRAYCIVSAPSGYGKTTAVAEWAAGPVELAWLTLNALDSDPRRLARGVMEALVIGAELGGRPLALPVARSDPRRAYAAIIDALDDWAGTLHLVVDDAHRAGEHWRDGLLGMLLDQMPDNLRVVLIGTTLLEITSSRERLTDPGAFLGADLLRFTVEEVAALHAPEPIALDPKAILEETQGWPIAVKMVMIGGVRPVSEAASASAFLTDYVRDHVLGALPDEMAQFVLDASVCAELDAELAIAVTQRPDAGWMLDECVRLGMFLDRFSSEQGSSYRWHASFARTCDVIRGADPVRAAESHRRAAAHLRDEAPIASIAHSLRAGDVDGARDTLARRWLGLLMRGSAVEVDSIVTELLRRAPEDPELLLIRASATDALGEHHLARDLLHRAEVLVLRSDPSPHALVLDIARLMICDDQEQVGRASARVHERIIVAEGGVLVDHAAVNHLLGWAEIQFPTNPALPAERFAAASRELRLADDEEQWMRAVGHLAFGRVWAGRFREATAELAEVGGSADPSVSAEQAGSSAVLAAGLIAHWSADALGASRAFASILNGSGSDASTNAVARMMIAYAAAEGGDLAACRRAAIGVQDMPVETMHGIAWGVCRESAIAVLEEAIGNQERALRIARKHLHRADLPIIAVSLAGVLRRAGEYSEALVQLRSLRAFAEVSYVKSPTLITAAVLRRHQGDHTAAHDLCEAALAVAVPEGIRLPFGPREIAVRRLLSEHVHHGTQFEDFIGECLASDAAGSLATVLSEREQQVFRQLQTSRTLPEIAHELGVSINTVKTHQRSIYRKLDVSSRREAVRTTV
ncbi:LuxR C-terminal-related transcriptional regulator [Microbacterium sp. H1-D42]|uniref:LuxR C-terminal-related transcriptional regulator n=1 Tax=Microbacterium sp. H1-D42 TaxID=2925844 RepID=UPI001F532A59|nr:LuxR C-terminal-related transcriptional regulator [Microbacterium sp. H1-D42]UNK72364.1 LuxR C-terminal-related transcriptional regulator [Microbacterium sp. H1-D42]